MSDNRHVPDVPLGFADSQNEEPSEGYAMQVDLQATTREVAELEAESLVVIPYATLDSLLTLLDGRQLKDGETIASVITAVKEYM